MQVLIGVDVTSVSSGALVSSFNVPGSVAEGLATIVVVEETIVVVS